MELTDITDILTTEYVPEATLAIGGILAVLIAVFYISDRHSGKYKIFMIIGMVFGVFMAIVAYSTYDKWVITTLIIMIVASFTLIIRPFKEVHFAVLIALMTMAIVYVLLGGLAGTQLEIVSEGWPRIGVAVFCGVIVYSLLHMLESVVKIVGKIMNAWPVLLVLGVICIIEAAMVLMGYGSVYDLIRSILDK